MKNSTHRSVRKKHLRRTHPNNQTLVVDTSLGRKKHTHLTHFPAFNIAPFVPPTILPPPHTHFYYQQHQQHPQYPQHPQQQHHQHHHQQQQQQQHRRREGPPSPPAHLRASVIFLPVPVNQRAPAAALLPPPPPPQAVYLLPRPVPVAPSSHNNQCQSQSQLQQHLQPLLPRANGALHNTTVDRTTTTYFRTHPTRNAQHSTPKPRPRLPKHQQQSNASSTRVSRVVMTLFNALARKKKNLANQRQAMQQRQRKRQWGEYVDIPESKAEIKHEPMLACPWSFHSASYRAQDFTQPEKLTTNTSTTVTAKKSCIYLEFAAYMITSLMLAYNGIMSVLLLQASRVPDDINIPVFVFSLIFLFTTILSVFGFLALSFSSWALTRVYHIMYLFTAFLTFASMLSYLAVNQSQTGTWDRILLDEPEAYDPIRSYLFISVESSSAPAFNPPERPVLQNMWLKGLLEMDPITKTWIISPWKWILAFGVIFASQCACWYYGLLAFDREARDRKAKGGNYSSGHDHSSRLVASEQA